MTKRRRTPPDVARIIEAARRNEQSAPRKHHLVPASYLRRWAEEEVIRVTVVDDHRTYVTSPEKAARETDFYRLEAEEIDSEELPPLLFETMLSLVEGWGNTAVDHLLALPTHLDPQIAANFASFLGFQFTRGASHREEMRQLANEGFKLQNADLSDAGIHHKLRQAGVEPTDELVASSRRLLNDIRDGAVRVTPQDAALVGLAGQAAVTVGGELLNRAWMVCETESTMVTCDEPVVLIGGPGRPRDERPGVGTAAVIVFPLAPTHVLALFREDLAFRLGLDDWRNGRLYRDQLSHVEVAELCLEVVGNTHRWAFERPSKRRAIGLRVPPAPEPATFEEAGVLEQDGTEGRLVRFYKANRWRNAALLPPWPVERWWS